MDQQKAVGVENCLHYFRQALTAEASDGKAWRALEELREEIVGGFLYAHSRANSNTTRVLEAASFLYALVELLNEKGIITIEQLDQRKTTVAKRVEKRFLKKGMGVVLQEPEKDKYTSQTEVQVDCENRLHLCKAACCRLSFPLSKQDIEEGVIKWDLRSPYLVAQDGDGYCKHLERHTCRCTVYQHRPIPCRTYDCRKDQRIWSDFEKRVINPKLEALFRKNQARETGETCNESSATTATP